MTALTDKKSDNIPTLVAAEIASMYGYDQVIIIGRRSSEFQNSTTQVIIYGIDPGNEYSAELYARHKNLI